MDECWDFMASEAAKGRLGYGALMSGVELKGKEKNYKLKAWGFEKNQWQGTVLYGEKRRFMVPKGSNIKHFLIQTWH